MDRLLVIPAAGLGSRLGAHTPKLLALVNGRPMLDHLLSLYAPVVDGVALVVHPAARGAVMHVLAGIPSHRHRRLRAGAADRHARRHPARASGSGDRPAATRVGHLVRPGRDSSAHRCPSRRGRRRRTRSWHCPTAPVRTRMSTSHATQSGRIVRVLHRREGDVMPAVGESDAGLFSLSLAAYLELLAAFAAEPGTGTATGERNFLPFIPWASARGDVVTFPCTDPRKRSASTRRTTSKSSSARCGSVRRRRRDRDPVSSARVVDRHPGVQRGAVHRHTAPADSGCRSRAARRRQGNHRRRRSLGRWHLARRGRVRGRDPSPAREELRQGPGGARGNRAGDRGAC